MMEKTLAIHLAEHREELAQWIEGMQFAFGDGEEPTTIKDAIHGTKKTIALAIRNSYDNWA
jgi:hypothetical protein